MRVPRSFLPLIFFLVAASSLTAPAWAIVIDNAPAPADSWGYRPSADIPATLNPPGFTWKPERGVRSYTLQVSKDDAFAAPLAYETDTAWSSHCPPEPFKEATAYYWRYRAMDKEGGESNWSAVRSFTIAPGTAVFPKPTVADAKKRASHDHPRIFIRDDDIARLRALAEGELADHWKNLSRAADKLLETPPDVFEPPLYPEGTKRLSEEWKKIWWGNRRRTVAVTNGAATLAFVYRITGEEKYGQAARDLLLAFCEWDPEGSTQYVYNDEAGMPALYFPSRAYTWAYPMLSEGDREKVREVMAIRGRQCFDHLRGRKHLWRPYASHSNRAWHFLGELSLAFLDEIPEAETWLDYALTVFYTCYPVWGDGDGGWHEGAGYWSSYIKRFGYWMLAMESSFGIDVFDRPFFNRTGDFGLYSLPPGSEHGGFGDQAGKMKSPSIASLMITLAAGAQNPYWKWSADRAGIGFSPDYVGFLWASKSTELVAKPPTDLPSSVCFRGVGVAVMNTDLSDGKNNVQLFFKSSPMGTISHGYNANNSFHLNVDGKPALLNTGRRDVHGSPHHREWMWRTKSQNALLVEGEGQIIHSPNAEGRIVAFETNPETDVVVGEAGESYDGLERWTRAIVFCKPDLILIHDTLKSIEPSNVDWLMHAPSAFSLEPEAAPKTASWKGEGRGVQAEFLYPATGTRLSQANGYDPAPHDWANFKIDEWHLNLATEEKKTERSFVTLLRIGDSGRDRSVEFSEAKDRPEAFRVKVEGNYVIDLAPTNLSVKTPGFDRQFSYLEATRPSGR